LDKFFSLFLASESNSPLSLLIAKHCPNNSGLSAFLIILSFPITNNLTTSLTASNICLNQSTTPQIIFPIHPTKERK